MLTFKLFIEEDAQMEYDVPEYRMEILNKQLDKINKRAAKLHMDPIRLVKVSSFTKEKKNKSGQKYDQVYLKLKIEGKAPRINGWKFIARILHSEGEFNIIKAVPGEVVPTKYRTAKPQCDHCHSIRRRNDTFILQNESGEYKQVGSSCLADFLRTEDPLAYVNLTSELTALEEELQRSSEDDGEEGWGGRLSRDVEILRYIALALAIIRKYGFVSKSAAMRAEEQGKNLTPTSSLIDTYYFGKSKDAEELRAAISPEIRSNDTDKAREIVDWAKSLKNTGQEISDYLWNISAAAENLTVTPKTSGLIASLPSAYKRAMGEIEDANKPNEPTKQPEVNYKPKDKFDGILTILDVKKWQTQYGITALHIMKDENGVLFKWKASSEDIPPGSKAHIKGTVKEVGPDKYAKNQITVELTRCKVLEMHMSKEHQGMMLSPEQESELLNQWKELFDGLQAPVPTSEENLRWYVFTNLFRHLVEKNNIYKPHELVRFDIQDALKGENGESVLNAKINIIKQQIAALRQNPSLDNLAKEKNEEIKLYEIALSLFDRFAKLQDINKKITQHVELERQYQNRTIHKEHSFSKFLKRRLMEVGQTGGVGGGLEPPKLNPLERGTNAFQKYGHSDDPPVGWSKTRRRVVKIKRT